MESKRTRGGWAQASNILQLLVNTPVTDHVPRGTTGDVFVHKEGDVMTVYEYESVPMVMRKLATEGFLSAPVIAADRCFLGFIDMMALTKYTCNLFWGETEEAWVDFWDKETSFQAATVREVMDTKTAWSPRPLNTAWTTFSTFHALEVMSRTGNHRLAVINDLNRVVGILTQSMIISMIRQNIHLLGPLRNQQIRDFENLRFPVTTCKETDVAINCFNKMIEQGVSGLPIVNDDGVLTGAVTVKDLRAVGANGEFFSRLFRPVTEFKRLAAMDYPFQAPRTHYSRKLVPVSALHVSMDSTLEDVINLMNDGNIHRVFVTTDSQRSPVPIEVISQKDVLYQVLQYCSSLSGASALPVRAR